MKVYILIETLATVLALILMTLACGRLAKKTRSGFFPCWLSAAARRPFILILLVGLLGFGASALVTAFTGTPQPRIHDEFSYLLAADTFAHGRLTNPSHPLWKHFETFHVIQQPTYASKYPPGQGMVLALGQVVFGHPIVGVWLSAAMACAAISWMLAGWCPLKWAWIGGLVAVVRIVFSGSAILGQWAFIAYWSQSYWGGTVAALGGALVFGALPRILKKQSLRNALCLALGLAILANSRPFEGLVVSIPVMIVLGIWVVRTREVGWGVLFCRILMPVVLVLFLTVLWMCLYNFWVTGDPFRMPYQVYESTYGMVPIFLWQPLKAVPPYNHKTLQEFYMGCARSWYLLQQSFSGWISIACWKVGSLWWFFIGPLFIPFFAALPKMLHRRSVQFALGTWALLIAALLAETSIFPHYAAPATSLAFLLVVESLRQARLARWRGRPVGQALICAVLLLLLISAIASFAWDGHLGATGWHLERARMLRDLKRGQERHLVIVSYGPKHSPLDEWVYNRADIDAAKVVFAREMGPQADRELLEYFKDRRAWLLKADQLPRRLTPYTVGQSDK
jgi:hypothetical protein